MTIDPGKDFGTRECPGCATRVPANSNRCPLCGYDFPALPRRRKMLTWLAAAILLAILLWQWLPW